MNKIISLMVLVFLFCGVKTFSQIYVPVSPTVYGVNELRHKAFLAQHIPEKTSLLTNTNDTTAQIFMNKGDSNVWAYYKPRGFFKIGSGGGGFALDSIYVFDLIDTNMTLHPGHVSIFVSHLILDSLKHKYIDTGARMRNGYVLSFDSTNKKWVMVPNAGGGGGGVTADNGLTVNTGSNVQLGGTLTSSTHIAKANNDLLIDGRGNFDFKSLEATSGSRSAELTINADNSSIPVIEAVITDAADGLSSDFSVQGGGLNYSGTSTSDERLYSYSVSSGQISWILENSTTGTSVTYQAQINTNSPVISMSSQNSTTGDNGAFKLEDTAFNIVSKLLRITGSTGAHIMNTANSGQITFNQYGSGTFTGTPAFCPAFDADGNIIEVSCSGGGGGNTIYNSDDTITSNRVVELNGNDLNFENASTELRLNINTGDGAVYMFTPLGKELAISDDTGGFIASLEGGNNIVLNSSGLSISALTNSFIGSTWDWNDGGSNHYLNVSSSGVNINNSFTLPLSDGSSNQFMKTSGSGIVSWSNIDTTNISNFSIKVRSLFSSSSPLTYNNATGAFAITAMDATHSGYVAAGISSKKRLGGDGNWYDTTASSTGTVTSIATGYGLSGGTITTTGTIIADSTLLLTKLRATSLYEQILSGTGYSKFSGQSVSYLTPTQVTADLNLFTTSLQGLVPGGGTASKVLHGDGTWKDTTTVTGQFWKLTGNTLLNRSARLGTNDTSQVHIGTKGTDAIVIDSLQNTVFSGKVGINTTPNYYLDIVNSNNTILRSINITHSTFTSSNNQGIFIANNSNNSGDNRGMYINAANGGSGKAYSIYGDGGILYNLGSVGIGQPLPTAKLHIAAGTATANTEPLKFTSGTSLTTPEAGAVEYDGTHFYGTTSTPTRIQLDNQGTSYYTHNISTPTTGGTVSLTNNQYNIINPAGALLALTVNLPSSPANNDVVYIKFTQTITTVTYANGTVVDGIAGPAAGGVVILVYDAGTTSWY